MNSKYSGFLTVLLVLIIIAIVGIIGFLGFKYYQTNVEKKNSEEATDAFLNQIQNGPTSTGSSSIIPSTDNTTTDNNNNNSNMFDGVEGGDSYTSGSGGSSSDNRPKYNGYIMAGTIEIPATNLKCPILDRSEYSPAALETAVVELYGAGLNQVGITTISGHNYRNNTFFSNNKKLTIGDKILITDSTGKRLSYTIYDKFEAEENYSDYMVKDTQGAIEIALSTCTDDAKARIIILARADV